MRSTLGAATFLKRATAGGAGLLAALALVAGLSGCASTPPAASNSGTTAAPAAPPELIVSAASSLKNIVTATAPAFEKANNVKLTFDFGASGQLVKQIEGGAPVDVFLSASPAYLATLAAEGLASGDASATFAGNTLVILVPKDDPAGIHGPNDLKKAAKLATGDPAVAPHGAKAVEWLTNLGIWDALKSKFVFAANAAQTDDYIARGEVDAGIGFASDAHGRTDIQIAYTVPDGQIKPIRYVGVPVVASEQQALDKAYLAYLLSPAVQAAYVDAGFKPAPVK